jgi:N-acetylglucosaminyl-diphospho-decaprenol L-rhamnosyltransferase
VGHGQEACYLVRRSALADVGVQDESYRLDWEGVDWSARVARAGWEIWFCPAADVVHVGGTSMRKARVRWIVWSHRGMLRYFAADAGLARRLALLVVIGLRMGIKLAASSARRDLYARALRAGDV